MGWIWAVKVSQEYHWGIVGDFRLVQEMSFASIFHNLLFPKRTAEGFLIKVLGVWESVPEASAK